MKKPTKVVVIGGGISGLVASNELVKKGATVILLEAENQLGGLAGSFLSSGQYVDKFYHCIMPTDANLLDVIEEVGLGEQLYWKSTGAGIIYNERRYAFNTPLDLLRFRPLSFYQRLRLGIVSLLLQHLGDGVDLDSVRTDDWMRKIFGNDIWQKLWGPLFQNKFGCHSGKLPALYIRQRMGRERNLATRGYLKCGMRGFIEALAESIQGKGGVIRLNRAVDRMETEAGVKVVTGDGEGFTCDRVLATVAIPMLREIVRGSTLKSHFREWEFPYRGVVITACFLSRPLDGYYMVPMLESGTGFDGLIEMTTVIDPVQCGNRHLIYLMKYCDHDSKLLQEDEDRVASRWCSELLRLYSDLQLRKEEILATHVFKAPFVEPAYETGYLSVKPSFQAGNSPLFLATSAQIYPDLVSMNAGVRIAQGAVDHICERLVEHF